MDKVCVFERGKETAIVDSTYCYSHCWCQSLLVRILQGNGHCRLHLLGVVAAGVKDVDEVCRFGHCEEAAITRESQGTNGSHAATEDVKGLVWPSLVPKPCTAILHGTTPWSLLSLGTERGQLCKHGLFWPLLVPKPCTAILHGTTPWCLLSLETKERTALQPWTALAVPCPKAVYSNPAWHHPIESALSRERERTALQSWTTLAVACPKAVDSNPAWYHSHRVCFL